MIGKLNKILQGVLDRLTTIEASMTGISSYMTATTAKVKKTGNVVDLTFIANVKTAHTINGATGIQIGIIPEGYIPSERVIRTVYVNQGAICKLAILWINTDGSAMVYSADQSISMAVNHGYRICTTYQL